ncbi:glycosyltransferase family 9 protein [Nonomuraea insulae]|uniref:Glycosyltransferase family 9 protein n=1 Tax=Nonomuraea insulae TaxID=1616787 RepID=A0ABW1D6X3_9ACTN
MLRALGLGDLLTSVPALRGLRTAYPDHEIVLAAPAELAAVAQSIDAVDRLLVTTASDREVPAAIPWHGEVPEIAIDMHGNGPPSHRFLEELRPRLLMAFAHPETPWIDGPEWRSHEHERYRWCRLLAAYGIASDPDDLWLPVPAEPSPAPGAILIHPGAHAPARRWPAERFASVASTLTEMGHQIVITASAGEAGLAWRVAREAGLPSGALHIGTSEHNGGLPFTGLAALVAGARLVLCGDTGIAHLASALAVPSVVLFGPICPHVWGPPRLPRHLVLWHAGAPGDPNGAVPDPTLLRITVREVLAAVMTQLSAWDQFGDAEGAEPLGAQGPAEDFCRAWWSRPDSGRP